MNYNSPAKNDSTAILRIACAVVFVAFSFLWLYYFQADVMAVSQHALSHGQTHYNRTVGAVLITLVLQLLQLGVYSVTRLQKLFHALTYLPSMLALAMLTSAGPDVGSGSTTSYWVWLAPLVLILWGLGVWAARAVQRYESSAVAGLFSRRMWVNMFALALMMIGVTLLANTDAVFHYRTHAETALMEGDYEEALRVGSRSVETDSSLTMLRLYALSRQGQLGEYLFHYALVPSSRAMLPTAGGDVRLLRYPVDSLYRHLGAIPRRPMQPMEYLNTILHSGQAKPAAADYLLCGYLIDRDLDAFASALQRFYTVNDSLPRHYREALVLYTHRRAHPLVVYHDPVLDVDYDDLQRLEEQYPLPTERRSMVRESYANSYWYYYEYGQ